MEKTSKLKTQINELLGSPPHPNLMLQELNFNSVVIKQVAGNIEMFGLVNSNLIEKIWKALKLKALFEQSEKEFKKLGINKNVFASQKLLIDKSGLNNLVGEDNSTEGFSKEEYLEIEVFSDKTLTIN